MKHLTNRQIEKFKKLLEDERDFIEKELKTVSVKNPNLNEDWVPDVDTTSNSDGDEADRSEHSVDYQKNIAITADLEKRLNNVNLALDKIKEGKYGICEKSGDPIEVKRLEANPAARTCINHKNEEEFLI